jgi:hypothetical protein
MIRIEIDSTTVEERKGTSAKGKPYLIREQSAYAHVLDEKGKPGKYPVRTRISLDDGQEPYAAGNYTFDARAVIVGDFDRLTLGRVKLVPLKAAA